MIVGIYKMQIKEINIKNRVYSYHFNNLITVKMLSLHYHELMGETEEHEGKNI